MAEAPDLSAISTSLVKFGGSILSKQVNKFAPKGVLVYKNVKMPIPLAKISAQGGPRPYRAQDDTSGNGAAITDRVLTVYQSKWDYDVDYEKSRNTYLADLPNQSFGEYVASQIAKEYMAAINNSTAYLGVYNASGSNAAAIATGWGTLIADLITATTITPVTTGAITSTNAVDKVETVAEAAPSWMKELGFRIHCSFATLEKYKKDYRTKYGFTFQPDAQGEYKLDGMNAILTPQSFMNSSARLIATPDNNLVVGTDGDSIQMPNSIRRNIVEVRAMMPIGFQIADLDSLIVNDQA